ncbi:MAG: TetM/TetW/TetO/TetS family tetracycline resistance ribosomal protection protein [Sporichthyaceae bacterium]|nr:TetM/TetW/TetO/TetS family tetracycline resistance ribosomal protection protein [Sporichthyaceae bacterium]
MSTLNLGILAHVDAGKTSLTERLLFNAGVIDEIGSVDAGSTQTDTLALERQRGITIKSAVVSFAIGDVTVNLIDTPGHPDFIAEVERVLNVLDGAVLVISAVEGVQAQTRVLMRTLQRLGLPTLVFVNKIDRSGAQYDGVLRGIADRLTPALVPMGSVRDLGTREAGFARFGAADAAHRTALAEVLADHDDALLAVYVDDETAVPYRRLSRALGAQVGKAQVHPVFFGSASTGAGVEALTAGISDLLPAADGNPDGPVAGTVFKVERGPAGEKIAYVRMLSGTVRVRDRLQFGQSGEGKVTAISVFDRGSDVRGTAVAAGQIGKLWGLADIQIGDALGASRPASRSSRYFAPPTLETVVVPSRRSDKGTLHAALAQLTEQDPLINLRQDDIRQEVFVSLYGEVQKEVIQATLANDYAIDVTFRESTTIYIERTAGTGADFELIDADSNPFNATIGLRIEPAPVGSGVEFRLEVELGSMPFAFFKAVEETVHEALQQGLYGWQVTDCTVTMTHSGYWPRQSAMHAGFDPSMSSTAGDFRNLTPLILMSALKQAGSTVFEPVHRFQLEIPADTLGPISPVLVRVRAVPQTTALRGSSYLLEGEIPAAMVHELQQQLPAVTRGEGVLESGFDHYQPVRGVLPTRPRSDHNPLDRKEYLLRLKRRVAGHQGW